jgi:cellobiose phosphorylase
MDAGAVVKHYCQQERVWFSGYRNRRRYTWSVNSRENRLTPRTNDAISDPPGEIVYLR